MVDILLSAGADVNAAPGNEGTPLLVAIHNRNETLVEKLIHAGAAFDSKLHCYLDKYRTHEVSEGLLIQAIEWGNLHIVKLLVETGVDINEPGALKVWDPFRFQEECSCRTPLTMAILMKNWSCAHLCIKRCCSANLIRAL